MRGWVDGLAWLLPGKRLPILGGPRRGGNDAPVRAGQAKSHST
jgi:hypothetical protein